MMQKAFNVLASLMLVLMTACSTPPSPPPSSAINDSPYQDDLMERITLGETTVIKFTIPMHSEVNFRLLNTKHAHNKHNYLANINFSDINCTNGHNAALEYKQSPSDYYTRYFDHPAKWGEQHTLSLRLSNNKKELVATLNNETITINAMKPMRYLTIMSDSSNLSAHNIQVLTNKE